MVDIALARRAPQHMMGIADGEKREAYSVPAFEILLGPLKQDQKCVVDVKCTRIKVPTSAMQTSFIADRRGGAGQI